jgi:hypothetical protein
MEIAQQRLAGLHSITPAPDFGAELTIAGYAADIVTLNDKLNDYNQSLAAADQKRNEFEDLERSLAVRNIRILSLVKGKYGPDSKEYEQVGGIRTSHRRVRTAKPKKLPAT